MSVSRRSFLGTAPLIPLPSLWTSTASPSQPSAVSAAFPTQPPELIMEMVGASHANLTRVKELLGIRPTLARAAWDWGFGDWEDALGAASHMGNKEIAALLLANGARPTIFSATMLGQLDVVKAFIAAAPGIESTPGPHGITLLAHAEDQAMADYLRTLPGANRRAATQPIAPEQEKALAGEYVFGPGPTERITVAVAASGGLNMTRTGTSQRRLTHVGDMAFYPTGATLVRIRFRAAAGGMTLTVHDPDLILEARRS